MKIAIASSEELPNLLMEQSEGFSDEELLDGRTLEVNYVTQAEADAHDPEFGELKPNVVTVHTDHELRELVAEGLTVNAALARLCGVGSVTAKVAR